MQAISINTLKKSPEMRFVFKIILNLQKIQNKKNINFKQFYNSPKLLLLKKNNHQKWDLFTHADTTTNWRWHQSHWNYSQQYFW
jgi:hypothetical protein